MTTAAATTIETTAPATATSNAPELFRTYANVGGARRAAKNFGLANWFIKTGDNGRIELWTGIEKPIQKYRRIFRENFGEVTWSEMIDLAVENGINQNTAKTYYYTLKNEIIN